METLHERSFAYGDDNDRFGINANGIVNSNANNTNNNNANCENPADPDVDVLRDRLNKVRRAVHKATQEAWKQANGHSPSLSSLQKENASFLLGMDLFGSSGGGGGGAGMDTSMDGGDSSSGLELTIRDKLEQVERDLSRIQKESDALPSSAWASGSRDAAAESSEEAANANNNKALSGEELSDQIENYRRKVAFLRQASLARSCLEESTALTSSASSSAGASATSDSDSEGGTTTTITTPDNNNLVRSAQTLLRALQEVDEAERILRDDLSFVDDSSSMAENKKQQKEIEVAHRILSSLRHQIRRHRVELVHKAGTVLDGSVELTPGSIAVKSSEQLTVAYKVLETLDDAEQAATHNMLDSAARAVGCRGRSKSIYCFRRESARENTDGSEHPHQCSLGTAA